jgi:uncharacterized protein Yka (UPF0111/DUF47 family)
MGPEEDVVLLDRMVKWLLPRENSFFVYLDSMAGKMVETANIFAELRTGADGPAAFKAIADRLREKEHEADEIAHLIYEELDRNFVTPLDREDLHAITSALDDVVDVIESTASRMAIYSLPKLTAPMKELIRITQESAAEVAKSIHLLQDLSKVDEIQVHIVHVNSLENEGDRIYRTELERVFREIKDPIELIREKEVLAQLERAIDNCEDVMDVIRSVVVKNG